MSQLLKSFTGSQEDQFIQARLVEIHRRFLKSRDVEPTRGFDAITACLIDARFGDVVAGWDDQRACERLAVTVAHGAAAGDRFVRNLLQRIRAATTPP